MVAMLRNCGEAPESSACDSTAYCCLTSAFQARSLLRTMRADAQAAVGQLLDLVQRKRVDIDQPGRVLDAELHQVDQRRAPGDEFARVAPAASALSTLEALT